MTERASGSTKRRPRGDGSLTRRGDGRWRVRLRAGEREYSRVTATQREARAALLELQALAELGVAPRRMTVADALDEFLAHGQASRRWAPATTRSYQSTIDLHLKPTLGSRGLRALTVSDVQRLIDRLLTAGHSGRHVAHVRGVLRAALAHAMRLEFVHRNVAALAASPTVRPTEMQALSADQLACLFSALKGERLRPLIVTAATLGLRRGELIALRWADVDLDAGTLTVRRTAARIGGAWVEGPPKTERARRTLSLPASLVAELRRHSAAIAEERLRLGAAWQDEDRVFPGESGGPLGESSPRKALERSLVRAGLPHVRVHDLRHSAATLLLAAGGSLRDAQELLGHTSFTLTANTYAHVLDAQRKATADRLEGAIGGAIAGSRNPVRGT